MKKFDKNLFKNLTILYVEDDVMTLEEISFFLRKYVKELIVAKNGKEGLELFKKHKVDMVITDIQMPVMNGLEMSEKIYEINPSIPIAVTTAYSDSNYIIKAIELGIDKYIIKPINMQEILAVVQKSLNLIPLKNVHTATRETHYEDYIQFILDSNPAFMFIMHSDEVEYANRRFLELLGHENVVSLKEQIKSCENLFEIFENESDKSWVEYIIENKKDRHLVHLRNSKCKKYLKTDFFVTYKHFDSTNKSVFVFVDANEEKLNKIHTLTSQLLKSENKIDKSLLTDLQEILKISQSSS